MSKTTKKKLKKKKYSTRLEKNKRIYYMNSSSIYADKKSNNNKLILIVLIISLFVNAVLLLKNNSLNSVVEITKKGYEEELRTYKEDYTNYLFLGDSITDFYDLDKYYDGLPVVNSGISGNTTEDILNDMKNRVYDYNPSKVFLLIGTNDLIHDIGVDDIISNIEKIISEIKGKKYCDENNYTYINMYDKLLDDDGNFSEEYTDDGLHPNENGYEIITKELKKYLD